MTECEFCGIELELLHPPSKHLFECPACRSVYHKDLMTKKFQLIDDKHEEM